MKWKCEICEKEFKVGDWICQDGISNHVVAEKTYRALDAPADPGRPASGSLTPVVRGKTVVCNIPPAKHVIDPATKEARQVGEGSVEFLNGRYSTRDPERQYWLDKKPGYNSTEDQWKACWLTKDEMLEEKRLQLVAMEQRLENHQNDLLAQTKRKAGAA